MRKRTVLGFISVGAAAVFALAWLLPERDTFLEIGDRLPAYSAPNLNGEEVAFADLEGQVALVTVWATWCGPCRVEMPSIQAVYEQYRDEGFTVLAVSIDADPKYKAKVEDFREEYGLTFPMLLDPENEITRTLNTIGVPENFVLDREGRIVKRVIGASRWDSEANQALIEELLRM